MNIDGQPRQTITLNDDGWSVTIIDQRRLPHELCTETLETLEDCVTAIRQMWVRGAPLIGVTAAYGIALAMRRDPGDASLQIACQALNSARPTAVNLSWATQRMNECLACLPREIRAQRAYEEAARIRKEDIETCSAIGEHGLGLLRDLAHKRPGERLNILTHCNAGWLATVDWGTALAPIYKAFDAGIPLHVYVDETRPRNQGASLTAWELGQHGVPHTVIVDNAGGHLMQHGMVDVCIVGSDRTTATGDVCNKVGTYLKALAAHDNGIPFYAAVPASTIDWTLQDGVKEIPIEERCPTEVTHIWGKSSDGAITRVELTPPNSPALNIGFDVTPARLVSGIITERGTAPATKQGLLQLFPERTKKLQ